MGEAKTRVTYPASLKETVLRAAEPYRAVETGDKESCFDEDVGLISQRLRERGVTGPAIQVFSEQSL